MRNKKPIFLLVSGSAIVCFLTLIIILGIHFFITAIPLYVILIFPILVFFTSYFTFYYFITVFLNERLKLIYRSIRKGKITKDNTVGVKLTDDVISNIENETFIWSKDKNQEISKLKEQEEFRREFLGNLAHELKTPVFSIQGYILTLLDGALEDENVNRTFLERASM